MKKQNIENQAGEIKFRKKLIRQQIDGEHIFDDEFGSKKIDRILRNRMKDTLHQMMLLQRQSFNLSPYIEIGAERCQRSLVMENDIGSTGAALDISYDMLKSCDHYKKIFKKCRLPLRVCCDINNIPVKSNSIPFVFCYQTLHHFPDPKLIVDEVYRIISPGGCFFFDDEPYKKILHVNIYKSKKIYSEESSRAGIIKRVFDRFLSSTSCNEIEHGVIENEDIPIGAWKRSLNRFYDKKVELKSMKYLKSGLFGHKKLFSFLLAYLLGGSISGICCKKGTMKKMLPLNKVFICPDCMQKNNESKLAVNNSSFVCRFCRKEYPIINKVVFLLPDERFKKLYPFYYKRNTIKKRQ